MKVNQDSRTIKKGEWFVAVKGEDFDGHDFIPEALKKGAAGVLEEEELLDLAKGKIKKLNPKVVAVTGSYGKTSTKEAVAQVLGSKFKVLRTSGNLNTPRGISIEVVNRLKPSHEVLVVEMAMDRLGEIKESCQILSPQVGIITSVGEMHLEKLKSLENIKKAKAELLESLSPSGVAVLNYDDPNVREIAKKFKGRKVRYGLSPRADSKFSTLKVENLGEGSRYAASAAYAVGEILRVPKRSILRALRGLKPLKGRLNLLAGKGGSELIDDTYNSGPRSVAIALKVLREFPAGRRIVILGDMLELGKVEEEAHRKAVKEAVKVAERCVFVGERMGRATVDSACVGKAPPIPPARGEARQRRQPFGLRILKPEGFPSAGLGDVGVYLVQGAQEAVKIIRRWKLGKGDVILVKGSRGMHMEAVVRSLLRDKRDISKLVS